MTLARQSPHLRPRRGCARFRTRGMRPTNICSSPTGSGTTPARADATTAWGRQPRYPLPKPIASGPRLLPAGVALCAKRDASRRLQSKTAGSPGVAAGRGPDSGPRFGVAGRRHRGEQTPTAPPTGGRRPDAPSGLGSDDEGEHDLGSRFGFRMRHGPAEVATAIGSCPPGRRTLAAAGRTGSRSDAPVAGRAHRTIALRLGKSVGYPT
jgi:hypothetical protein